MFTRGLDLLTSDRRAAQFAERRRLVHATSDRLGLDATNAVLIGGAGFAAHGLDSRVKRPFDKSKFDVEAYVTRGFFNTLALTEEERRHSFRLISNVMPDGRQIDPPVVPVQFTGFHGNYTEAYDYGLTYYECYDDAKKDLVVVDGLPTVPADKLAAMKLKVGRAKDLAGVIQAHVIGFAADNPAVHQEAWQEQVAATIERVEHGDILKPHRMGNSMPAWLGHLAAQNFEHPAFENIPI
jgi:hypothetical protein